MSFLKIALVGAIDGWRAGERLPDRWSHFVPFVARPAGAPPLAAALAGAFVAAFFSFGGWWEVTQDRRRSQGSGAHAAARAAGWVCVIVTLVYIARRRWRSSYLVPVDRVGEGQAFVAQVGEAHLRTARRRRWSRRSCVVCVLGSLGAMQMIAPRVYFAMAQDGVFPAAAAALHPRFGTPARAIAIQAVLASVLVGARHVRHDRRLLRVHHRGLHRADGGLGVRACGGAMQAFAFRAIRGRRWHFSRMAVVLLGMLIAVNNPLQALLGLGLVALAIPFYRVIRRNAGRPDV